MKPKDVDAENLLKFNRYSTYQIQSDEVCVQNYKFPETSTQYKHLSDRR